MSTKKRFIITLLAIVLLLGVATATPAITIVVYATDAAGTASSGSSGGSKSTTAQMAANSAAWHVAADAGDTATCNALHAANVALANSAASGGGSASFNASAGTWNITTSSGGHISSSGGGYSGDHTQNVQYASTDSSGNTTTTANYIYTPAGVEAYLNAGGTVAGLEAGYNLRSNVSVINNAKNISSGYINTDAKTSAENEVAVVKSLLGLNDKQASELQSKLEEAKAAYYEAATEYKNTANGEYGPLYKYKNAVTEANAAAEAIRNEYGYSGNVSDDAKVWMPDSWDYKYQTGGFFQAFDDEPDSFTIGGGGGSTPSSGGGSTTIINNYVITASAEAGATITPSGQVVAAEGSSKTFTIAPASSDYVIKTIYIDGEPISPQTTHTFGNITAPHTIRAVGAPAMTLEIGDIDLKDPSGKDLTAKDSYIRSGYGIEANCDLTLTGATVTKAYATMANGDVCQMEMVGSKLQFVVNKASKTSARRYYIPVETKDGDFDVTVHVEVTSEVDAAKKLTQEKTLTVTISGSMYDDDFTGDRGSGGYHLGKGA